MYFKYLPPERIDVLRDRRIRFSPISSFTDRSELVKPVDPKDRLEAFLKQEEIISNESIKDWTEDELPDFHQMREAMINEVRGLLSPEAVGREVLESFDPKIGILSLCRTRNSHQMWDHYAKGFTGFVIGFDKTHRWISPRNPKVTLMDPQPVRYTNEEMLINENDPDASQHLYCTKLKSYFWEKEIRLLRPMAAGNLIDGLDAFDNPIHLFPLEPAAVKEIIVGEKASQEIKEIAQAFQQEHPRCVLRVARACQKKRGQVELLKMEVLSDNRQGRRKA